MTAGGPISARLAELGITLPPVTAPLAAYVPAVRTGNLVYTSGQLPMVGGKPTHFGLVGAEVTPEEAKAYVETALDPVSPNAVATVTVAANVVTTRVTVPAGDLQLIGILAPLSGVPITVQGRHYIEDYGT